MAGYYAYKITISWDIFAMAGVIAVFGRAAHRKLSVIRAALATLLTS